VFGRSASVAQIDQRVVDERMVNQVDRHRFTLYNLSSVRVPAQASPITRHHGAWCDGSAGAASRLPAAAQGDSTTAMYGRFRWCPSRSSP
jgi:hypothetical protein